MLEMVGPVDRKSPLSGGPLERRTLGFAVSGTPITARVIQAQGQSRTKLSLQKADQWAASVRACLGFCAQ